MEAAGQVVRDALPRHDRRRHPAASGRPDVGPAGTDRRKGHHFVRRRRRAVRTFAAVTAAALSAGILAACSSGDDKAAPTPSPTPSATPTPKPKPKPKPSNASPLTGWPGGLGKPVLVVKIDNTTPAHPQVGIDDADIVYLEQVEGGLTRLAAVFSGTLPRTVGPVRSARQTDIELFAQYGRVAFAYSGAQHKVLTMLHHANLALAS